MSLSRSWVQKKCPLAVVVIIKKSVAWLFESLKSSRSERNDRRLRDWMKTNGRFFPLVRSFSLRKFKETERKRPQNLLVFVGAAQLEKKTRGITVSIFFNDDDDDDTRWWYHYDVKISSGRTMLSSMLKLSIARFICWYESVRGMPPAAAVDDDDDDDFFFISTMVVLSLLLLLLFSVSLSSSSRGVEAAAVAVISSSSFLWIMARESLDPSGRKRGVSRKKNRRAERTN